MLRSSPYTRIHPSTKMQELLMRGAQRYANPAKGPQIPPVAAAPTLMTRLNPGTVPMKTRGM